MINNSDITIYNLLVNKKTRELTYQRTIIRDVYVEKTAGIKLMAGASLNRDDKVFVLIHKMNQKGYKKPKAFEKSPGNSWTLRPEDIIVIGPIETEIASEKELESQLDDVYKITQVDEHFAGSLGVHHWEVRAK